MATAEVYFFHGRTRALLAEQAANAQHVYFNALEHGGGGGELKIFINDANRAFLESLRENSHFISIAIAGVPDMAGGAIETAFCTDDICSIKFGGFIEKLSQISSISSYKASSFTEKVVIKERDKSWEKDFWADSPQGLTWELFNNLEEYMAFFGYTPFWLWDSSIIPSIVAASTNTWAKTYHLNSAEFPKMSDIIEDVVKDPDCSRLEVKVDTSDSFFKWKLNFQPASTAATINTLTDDVSDLSFEYDGIKSRTFAIAKGEDKNGNSVISRIGFSTESAFSDYAGEDETSQNSTAEADRINRKNIFNLSQLDGQVSYKTAAPELALVSMNVVITTDSRTISLITSEYSYDSDEDLFTITGKSYNTTENVQNLTPGRPEYIGKRQLEEPLFSAYKNARKQAFSEKKPTGWRKL